MAPAIIIVVFGYLGAPSPNAVTTRAFAPAQRALSTVTSGLALAHNPEVWSAFYPAASIGRAGNGRLLFGHQMENRPGLHVLVPRNSWSVPEVQWKLEAAAAKVLATHQTAPDLVVLDVSRAHGGTYWPHRGHQDGADVDLRLYLKGVPAGDHRRRRVSFRRFDAARTWTLIEWLHQNDAADRIFLDVRLQRLLYRHARRVMKRSPAAIAPILSYPKSRWVDEALVKHVRGHADHIHVRIKTPIAKAAGMIWTPKAALQLQQQIALRRRGDFDHIVRPGDTLSAIASSYGVGVRDITRWNPKASARTLRPGQVLRFSGNR